MDMSPTHKNPKQISKQEYRSSIPFVRIHAPGEILQAFYRGGHRAVEIVGQKERPSFPSCQVKEILLSYLSSGTATSCFPTHNPTTLLYTYSIDSIDALESLVVRRSPFIARKPAGASEQQSDHISARALGHQLPRPSAILPSAATLQLGSCQRPLFSSDKKLEITEDIFLDMERFPRLEPISDPRTLFLVNTFVIHTVRLLNNFSVICEDKLADVHRRIVHVDATLSLLEAKLRSVDGLEGIGEHIAQQPHADLAQAPGTPESSEHHLSTRSSIAQAELSRGDSMALALDQPEFLKVKDDPKFTRFFRMLQVGVPLPAVKIQMGLEGLDGSVLDSPDAISLE